MNKSHLLTASLLLIPFVLLASEGERQLKKSTVLLSANLILTQFDKDFCETAPHADFMYEQMIRLPDDYVKPDEAKAKLQEIYLDRVRADYRQKVNVLLSRIAEKNEIDDVFEESFRKTSGTISDESLKALRDRHFDASFTEQRRKACTHQIEQVTEKMFPTEEEVDTESEETLIQKLAQRLADAQKFQVFEENRVYLRDLVVAPTVKDAYRQRIQQSQFLEAVRSETAATPDEYALFLEKALQEALPQFKAENSPKGYAIFPSVKRTIPTLSEKKARARYLEFLQATTTRLTEEAIKKMILADLPAHQEKNRSRTLIRDTFMKQSMEQAPKSYIAHFPAERQNGVALYLEKQPVPEAELRAFFERFFEEHQQLAWEAARQTITAEQMEQYPSLQARTWIPDAPVVEAYTGNETTEEGRTLRKDLLKRTAISEQAYESALEETRNQSGTLLDQELARAGHALRRQRQLVLASSNDIASEASTRLATKKKPEKVAAELVERFLPNIQTQWRQCRVKEIYEPLNPKPGNAETAYLNLFPSVEELLRQLIRDIIQKLSETPPEPPEEPPPESPPPEEKEEPLKLACAFSIDMKENQILIRSQGDIVIDQATLPVAYDDYRKQESQALTRIADQFADLLAERSKGQGVELTLDIHVKNGMVYYQLVSRLRDRLDYRIKKLNNEKLNLKLSDKME